MRDSEIIRQIEDALDAAAKDPAQKARIEAWLKTRTGGDCAPANQPVIPAPLPYIPPPIYPEPHQKHPWENPWGPPFEVLCGGHPIHIATGGLAAGRVTVHNPNGMIGQDSWRASITNPHDPNYIGSSCDDRLH